MASRERGMVHLFYRRPAPQIRALERALIQTATINVTGHLPLLFGRSTINVRFTRMPSRDRVPFTTCGSLGVSGREDSRKAGRGSREELEAITAKYATRGSVVDAVKMIEAKACDR